MEQETPPLQLEYNPRIGYVFVEPRQHAYDLAAAKQSVFERIDAELGKQYGPLYLNLPGFRDLCHRSAEAYLEAFAQSAESLCQQPDAKADVMKLSFKRSSFIAYQHINQLRHMADTLPSSENWQQSVKASQVASPMASIGKIISACTSAFYRETGISGHVLEDYPRDVAAIFAESGWDNHRLRDINPTLAPPGNSLEIPPAITPKRTLRAA